MNRDDRPKEVRSLFEMGSELPPAPEVKQEIGNRKEEAKRVPDPRSQQSLILATLHLDIAGDIGETEIVPSEIAINAVLSTQ